MPTTGLSTEGERQLITLCANLGSRMSDQAFNALAAKFVFVGIETVVLRGSGNAVEVLLTQRPADDANWPGMWHSPGSIVRASDAPEECGMPGDFTDAFQRIEREIGASFSRPPEFADLVFIRGRRGPNICLIFVGQVTEIPTRGQFFPADQLPESLIEGHALIISKAVANYRSR